MKGDAAVIAALNRYLSFELTGQRQYLLHSGTCRHWGFERLARIQGEYSAEETRHAADIIARILLLDGTAAMQDQRPIASAPSVLDQLALDRALVGDAIVHLRTAVTNCERCRDYVSRDLLRAMLDDEEHHLHWLDTEIALAGKVGIQNYLQSQIGG